jgi:hypothetical protein
MNCSLNNVFLIYFMNCSLNNVIYLYFFDNGNMSSGFSMVMRTANTRQLLHPRNVAWIKKLT